MKDGIVRWFDYCHKGNYEILIVITIRNWVWKVVDGVEHISQESRRFTSTGSRVALLNAEHIVADVVVLLEEFLNTSFSLIFAFVVSLE